MITRDFSVISMTSQASLSLSLSLPLTKVTDAQYRKRFRASYNKDFIRPVHEYCPLVWSGAAACHLERLDKVQKRSLSLIGEGTIIDSLTLRRTVSALCLLYKLLSGPRLTALQPLLPAQLTPVDNPRTRHQLSESHSFRLFLDLPVRSNATIARSFPHMSGPGTHFRRQCWRMPLPSKASRPSRSRSTSI